jgi:hypothetical protein
VRFGWAGSIQISGLAAWYLLVGEVTLGVFAAGGVARLIVSPRRRWTLHTVLSWALVAAIAVHVGCILVGHYQGWGVGMVTEMGFGTVGRNCAVAATYLLLLVIVARYVHKIRPHRWWKRFHRLVPFPLLALGTVHGLLAGTNSTTLPVIVPGTVAVTALGAVTAARWYSRFARKRRAADAPTVPIPLAAPGRPVGMGAPWTVTAAACFGIGIGELLIVLPLVHVAVAAASAWIAAGTATVVGSVLGWLAYDGTLTHRTLRKADL